MFKQIQNLDGNEWYLISSLWLFLLFFILIAILLIRMKKEYSNYMENLPLEDNQDDDIES